MTDLVLSEGVLAAIDAFLRDHGWNKKPSGSWWHERTGSDLYTNLEALELSLKWDRLLA